MSLESYEVNQQPNAWNGLPYHAISVFYKNMFGQKVYKVPVSVPGTCPNREGLNGMTVCNFCDEWGSAARPENRDLSLEKQVSENSFYVKNRTNAEKFLIYFQSYTFSFSRVKVLRQYFEEAIKLDNVCGFVVGTRPDCISDAVLDLWNEYNEKLPVFIEFGVQSFNNKVLEWMSRGHTAEKAIWALERLKSKAPSLNVGIHLIFGGPEESDENIIASAKLTNNLPIHNVKLHNLHVLKNTPLEVDFNNGEFKPLEIDEYARRCALYLQYLDPKTPVHRLAANSSRSEELVAPLWTGDKMRTYQYFLDYMNDRGIVQGQKHSENQKH